MKNTFLTIIFSAFMFFIASKVVAQPTWSVDPHQYTYSMTITGKLFSGGTYSTDVNDKIGAFINGECCGIAQVKYIPSVNDYYVFLMVYSNSPTGNITFKVYDKSLDLEVSAKETIGFSINGNSGTSLNPFIFTAGNLNGLAGILSFTIPNQVGAASIVNKSVTLQESWRGNLKGIAAGFMLTGGAKAYVGGIEQISGITVNDFDKPVNYTVISEDLAVTSVFTVSITTANDIPSDIVLSDQVLNENAGSVLVGNLTTITDNPAETHSYSLTDGIGTDNQYFRIEGSQLFSLGNFNYEAKNSYLVRIRADDQHGGTVDKSFTISINDINDAPTGIQLSNVVTPIQAAVNSTIASLVVTDPDAGDSHTFSLQAGDGTTDRDNGKFYIEGNTLKNKVVIDFRKDDNYAVLVKVLDKAGDSVVVPLSILTQDQSGLSSQSQLLTFAINQQAGLTSFSGTDVTLQQHWSGDLSAAVATFTISAGAKAYVNSIEQITGLSSNDYRNPVSLVVEAADKSKTTYMIRITATNDIPTDIRLSDLQVPENLPSVVVGLFTTVTENPKETHVYSLISETITDYELFKTDGSKLLTVAPFNYETRSSYRIKVRADDLKGGTVDKTFTISVVDVNDAPTNIKLSNVVTPIQAAANTTLATLVASDVDATDNHTFSLQTGNGTTDRDNGKFYIEGNMLKSKVVIDFRKDDNYAILVKVTDKGGDSVIVPLSIRTPDQSNFSSHSQLLTFEINQQVGLTIFSGTDVSVQQHWSGDLSAVVAGFTLSADAKAYVNNVELKTGLSPVDFRNPVSLIVEAADKSRTTYMIRVKTINDIPTDIVLSNSQIAENLASVTVGSLTTVTENPKDIHVYSLVSVTGTDNALFKLNGSELQTVGPFNYEARSSYVVNIRTDDQKGGIFDKLFTIRVTNKNDAPVGISLSYSGFVTGAAANTRIGTLTAEDPDADDAHVFSLLKGDGTNDNGNELVKISGTELLLTRQITEQTRTNWNILIKVTDQLNGSYEKSLVLTQSLNHSPVITSKPIAYAMQDKIYVYQIEVIDIDGDPYSVRCDNLPGWLTLYPELGLLTGSPGNSEVGTYNFTVIASDNQATVSQKVTLMVLNVNDAPEINYFVSDQVFLTNKENQFVIPDDCFTDIDAGDKLSYSISMSNNSALPSWLSFDPATKTLKGNPSKVVIGTYSLKLTATDQKLLKEAMVFNLQVTFPTAAPGLNDAEFSVWPNPVVDVGNLSLPENFHPTKLQVADAKGTILRNIEIKENSSGSIYLGDLPQGVYFLSLQNDKSRLVRKIIKQ